LIISKVLEKS